MKIGVFFGSFNPIHLGHLAIAERFLQEDDLDQVWLSVSPHNPLKAKSTLLETALRSEMAQIATQQLAGIKVTGFEELLPQPSYTYEALLYLQRKYPNDEFVLLIGGDNCGLFDRWANSDKILAEFEVWAYPRSKDDIRMELANSFRIIEAPLLDFASTSIRRAIETGKEPTGLAPKVKQFIEKNNLYKK